FINESTERGELIAQNTGSTRDEAHRLFYEEKSAGTSPFIRSVGFSFRDDKQYAISSLTLHETRWQQWYRTSKQTLKPWNEPTVFSPANRPTMPFPGYNSWTGKR